MMISAKSVLPPGCHPEPRSVAEWVRDRLLLLIGPAEQILHFAGMARSENSLVDTIFENALADLADCFQNSVQGNPSSLHTWRKAGPVADGESPSPSP